MYTVYLLYSSSFQKSYVGYTSDLQARLLSHNSLAKKGWTIKFRPWQLIYTEVFESKMEAMNREKWMKSGIGREYVHAQIQAWIQQVP